MLTTEPNEKTICSGIIQGCYNNKLKIYKQPVF